MRADSTRVGHRFKGLSTLVVLAVVIAGCDRDELAAVESSSVWLVSGEINDGVVSLDPIFTRERPAPADPGQGSHRLEARDEDGVVLTEQYFTALPSVSDDDGEGGGDFDEPDFFVALLAQHEAAVELAVVDENGVTLTSLALDGDGPTLEILSPQAGDVIDELTVAEWQASEDAVAFLVDYSFDGGDSWDIVTSSTTAEAMTFHPDELAASTEAGASLLRVTATDGVASTSAVSGGFTVGSSPPTVGITSPDDGHIARDGEIVWLSAVAFDVDDIIDDEAVVWESDLDGVLGTGRELPLDGLSDGDHHITVTATDSHGNSASDEITVRIVQRRA